MQTITVPSASGSGIAGYPNSDYDTQGVKKYTRNPIRYPIIFKKKVKWYSKSNFKNQIRAHWLAQTEKSPVCHSGQSSSPKPSLAGSTILFNKPGLTNRPVPWFAIQFIQRRSLSWHLISSCLFSSCNLPCFRIISKLHFDANLKYTPAISNSCKAAASLLHHVNIE